MRRRRLFLDYPASLGETYPQHLRAAAGVGVTLIATGLARLAHAIVPATFETTGSRTIRLLHARLEARRTPCPPAPPVL